MYDRTSSSQLQMIADRAMAFGSLIVGGVFVTMCIVVAVEFSTAGLWRLPVSAVALVGAAVSLWQVVATIVAMIRPKLPTAIQAALMQPNWPRGIRCLFAAWWLLHLFAGLALAISVLEEKPPSIGFVIFAVIASFLFTYAAYGFLMLATTCYTRNPATITRVWRWRVIWSYVHGLAALVVGIWRLTVG